MGLADKLQETLMAPITKLTEYKDNEIPKYQKETASEGKVPAGIPEKIEKIKKYKEVADKIDKTLRAIKNTIKAIEVAKGIAEAAKAAGQIGSALVPPVAAAGVLQAKIVEKVKEEIANAKSQLKSIDLLKDELIKVIIAIIIALLALRAKGKKDGKGGDGSGSGSGSGGDGSFDEDLEQELAELEASLNESGGGSCSLGPQYTTREACIAAGGMWDDGTGSGGSGMETIVRTTTSSGTTEDTTQG